MKTIYMSLILLLVFSSEVKSQWIKQEINLGGNGMYLNFFDEQTGYIDVSAIGLVSHLYKTTNGGANWILKSNTNRTYHICFLNDSIIIKQTYIGSNAALVKTTDSGLNWSVIYSTSDFIAGVVFVNELTGWICGRSETPTIAKVWRTTNGGQNFEVQLSQIGASYYNGLYFSDIPENGKYWGFSVCNNNGKITTNSGESWSEFIPFPYVDPTFRVQFFDRNLGFISSALPKIYKTTNGGFNWLTINLPTNSFGSYGLKDFKVINPDSVMYGVGGEVNSLGGIVWKSINGGLNWQIQNIDTINNVGHGWACEFINSNTGWISGVSLYKTTNGGGQSYVLGVEQTSSTIPDKYSLSQNYPNPFNPSTKINYELRNANYVILKIFDLLGKEVAQLVNEKQNAGSYAVDFNSMEFSLPSGIYFYTLNAGEFKETKKMVLVK